MIISKIDAATRQLDIAIQLFFEGRDPIAICTLTAAAGRIVSDLIEYHSPNQSWRSEIVKSLPHIPKKQIYLTMDRTPNFLKHADQDPEAVENFNELETEHRLFIACDECLQLIDSPTVEMEALLIWYVAANPERFEEEHDAELIAAAKKFLPRLSSMDRQMRIAVGSAFLSEQKRISSSELLL